MALKEITEMDDLISRWEAYKAVMDDENITNAMDSANDGEMHRTKRAASRIIAGLPSAQQWIPISEQMPEPFKAVLVYTLSDDGDHCFMTTASHEGGKYWYDECYYQRLNEVYAWMPLPKPYEVTE